MLPVHKLGIPRGCVRCKQLRASMVQAAESLYAAAMQDMQRGRIQDGIRGVVAALDAGLHDDLLADARSNLGTALSMVGRQEEARASYEAALRARPDSSLTLYNLGIMSADAGNAPEAERFYRRALAAGTRRRSGVSDGSQMGEVYNNLGNLLTDQERRSEQLAAFRASIHYHPKHALAYNNLGNVIKALADDGMRPGGLSESLRLYRTAMALWPTYPEAYRNMGSVLKERRRTRAAAARAYHIALRFVPNDRQALLNLGELLQWLDQEAPGAAWSRLAAPPGPEVPSPPPSSSQPLPPSPPQYARAANITYALAVARGVWEHPQQRPSHLVRGLRARPWWPTDTYDFVATLLRSIDVLKAEGLQLLREASFDEYRSPALVSGNWSDVTLRLSGSLQPGARRAPRTAALLDKLGAEVSTMVSGSAYFSVLTPGARLRPHCGPTNVRLRVHVGLSVPDGDVGMRVGNASRPWREGKALVFDDSFEHEV